jgi:5-formyltetrahydrofolate cyclo-ligase
MAQPVAAGAVVGMLEVDLMLVPGVGFDLGGARIGRGGGHYDRLLAERRSDCAAIGVTWTARIVDIVPMEAHDLRVDYLAVDTGVIPCSTTRQPPRPGS